MGTATTHSDIHRGSHPQGSLDEAVTNAFRLLEREPSLAREQAEEILRSFPSHPIALLVLAAAHRASGELETALEILGPLAAQQPRAPTVHFEHALALRAAGRGEEALTALRHTVALKPDLPNAWLMLADCLAAIGDMTGADGAYASHIRAATRDPKLLAPAAALCANDIPQAEALLREHLMTFPTDVAAIRMLGEVAARLGRLEDAEVLLARCLELAPGFDAARSQYAAVLSRQARLPEALSEVERLLGKDPSNPNYRNLKATILVQVGEYQAAIKLYRGILAEYPHQGRIWLSLGHVLKTSGQTEECVRAYRRSLKLQPALGDAYLSLANLKTFRFTGADIKAMRGQLGRSDLAATDRQHLHFALGKALEDSGEYSDSFQHYSAANRSRRAEVDYSGDDIHAAVERSRELYTDAFFNTRAGWGSEAPDPIFVVGLPRSGSTLIEQILASHFQVEGTMELHDLISIARGLSHPGAPPGTYPAVVAGLGASDVRALGERYLERTRIQRKTRAPFFIDKLPNNFLHLGLIHLILPRARIIDARRHPLGCCFSAFRQHFARGHNFSYDLEELGRYYRDYVALMAHFDAVLPGRVHRVLYERMVEDTEAEIRRLLEYCGLPFEPRCLRYYENERAVRTPSSEQVRRPIFREALEQWRHFEPWLAPLKKALGTVLETYPAVPTDLSLLKSPLVSNPGDRSHAA